MPRWVLILGLLGLFGAWWHFNKPEVETAQASPLAVTDPASAHAVTVYGRDNCAYTRNTLAALRSGNVPVRYVNIDYADASDAFHKKYDGTGLAGSRGYALPVVEVAGRASMRPDPDAVMRQFRSAQ